jgi:hypothetical protein
MCRLLALFKQYIWNILSLFGKNVVPWDLLFVEHVALSALLFDIKRMFILSCNGFLLYSCSKLIYAYYIRTENFSFYFLVIFMCFKFEDKSLCMIWYQLFLFSYVSPFISINSVLSHSVAAHINMFVLFQIVQI